MVKLTMVQEVIYTHHKDGLSSEDIAKRYAVSVDYVNRIIKEVEDKLKDV